MSETTDIYDSMVDDYAAMVEEDAPKGLLRFIDQMPKGGRVLDLGCGPGHHAAIMAQKGLEVLAVDGSAEMVGLAQQHAGVTAQQALFDDIPSFGAVDGVWASFSLLHAKRADFPRHVKGLHGICKSGASFMVGMKLGTGEGPDKLGRYYSYYSEDELNQHLTAAGFTVTHAHHASGMGLAGDVEPWIFLTTHA